jgi:lipid-A-disaccharide synthase
MLIAWIVIKVKYISLVNLIMEREVVTELIQYDLRPEVLERELQSILPGGSRREKVMESYEGLKEILGPPGASSRIAGEMVAALKDMLNN